MSIFGYPARERAVALTLLALMILALWVGPVSAYFDIVRAGSREIARQAELLQRYRTLDRTRDADAARDKGDQTPLMLPAMPEAEAVAQLQESVKEAAVASQVEIRSLQVLRSEALGSAAKIGVRINAASDMAGLGHLLFTVEAARPVLYADNLQIHSRPAAPGKAPEALDFQLDVSAFLPTASR